MHYRDFIRLFFFFSEDTDEEDKYMDGNGPKRSRSADRNSKSTNTLQEVSVLKREPCVESKA